MCVHNCFYCEIENLIEIHLCKLRMFQKQQKTKGGVFARTRVKVLKTFLVQQGCLQLAFQLSLFGSLCFRRCARRLHFAGRATQV